MKAITTINENGTITVTLIKKVTVYLGVYLHEDGTAGSTTYTDEVHSKSTIQSMFESDCKNNGVTLVKLVKQRTEKRGYTRTLNVSEVLATPDTTTIYE